MNKSCIEKQREIAEHFSLCDNNFVEQISKRTDLAQYIEKIANNAILFENSIFKGKSQKNLLVAFIGMYVNNEVCFITNLSVIKKYQRNNIASSLLNQAILWAKGHNKKAIKLEVHRDNIAACKLYTKFDFKIIHEDNFIENENITRQYISMILTF